MFDSTNATMCGSRMVQADEEWNHLLLTTNADNFTWHLSAFISSISHACYNCYFTGKESIISFTIFWTDMINFHSMNGQTIIDLMWFNQIYNSKEIFTSFRYIKRLLIERFNIRQLKPTKQL